MKDIPRTIATLQEFYSLMQYTKTIRKQIVQHYLLDQPIPKEWIDTLQTTLSKLESIPCENSLYLLKITEEQTIKVDLTYEISELKKDLFFLTHPEEEFEKYLSSLHPEYNTQVKELISFLSQYKFDNFISDRDGTLNNYCGRYQSSIQSAYNAVYMSRFAKTNVKNAVLLTAAPLVNFGLLDVSTIPDKLYVYSASKGREFIDKELKKNEFPIDPKQQEIMKKLNASLSELVKEAENEKFSLIGSGLQFKFGQTTIARQDINRSISEFESEKFKKTIQTLVEKIDPEHVYFRIEDTGKDLEIILTVGDSSEKLKDFDKGDGVRFLNEMLGLSLESAGNLVCGDTASDVSMVLATKQFSEHTCAVFVTQDESLKQRVSEVCKDSFFVDEPDFLVSALHALAS